ncbi:MAG: CopD family protein [Magnetospirillum sp.]|nr:CopD family protein [Magnetospirillum sp.]
MLAFALSLAFHTVAAVIWVGGMFFAHMVLRPAVLEMPPPERLALWRRVFPRFFRWVWLAILTLLGTGYGVLLLGYRGGLGGGGLHIDIMQVTGLIMVSLYVYLFVAPWQSFKRAFDGGDMPKAGKNQARIRRIVTINLVLGLFTAAIGATGMLWAY